MTSTRCREKHRPGWSSDEVHLDAIEVELAVVHQDQPGRAGGRDLAHQLRPDGAARAGHQDHLTGDPGPDLRPVQVDRLAAEQVLDRDRTQLIDAHLSAHEVLELGHGAERPAGPLAELDETLHLPGARARDREQDELDGVLGDQLRQGRGGAQHGDPVHQSALTPGLVVDESGGAVGMVGIPQHVPRQHLAGAVGPDDQDPLPGAQTQSVILEPAIQEPGACQQQQLQPEEEHRDGARQEHRAVDDEHGHQDQHRPCECRLGDAHQIGQ